MASCPAEAHTAAPATVNGVALHGPLARPDAVGLRQRACTELLRQAAQRAGLLEAADAPSLDGAISRAASEAIETLLERELHTPAPSEAHCRRHFLAHAERYARGERVHARHVLFAVTPGVDVVALRKRAEACLLELRCHDGSRAEAFANAARELSNCPSGAAGGDLGWLGVEDCAPEFARAVFGTREIGVLARLIHSRYGLHVVEVLERVAGEPPAFEDVAGAVASDLRQQAFATALRQYLMRLASSAALEGVELEARDSAPLQ
ncbi:MAG TPA: peptidylprolyl isomerase [Gammaproteobacteria bacterium]|nr:peptidylprolyl isomerase [Gammaproteobacteria bacterium]